MHSITPVWPQLPFFLIEKDAPLHSEVMLFSPTLHSLLSGVDLGLIMVGISARQLSPSSISPSQKLSLQASQNWMVLESFQPQ